MGIFGCSEGRQWHQNLSVWYIYEKQLIYAITSEFYPSYGALRKQPSYGQIDVFPFYYGVWILFYCILGMEGKEYQKCPSFFLYLWVNRTCVYLLIDVTKNCHQHSYSFKIWYQIGDRGIPFSKLPNFRGFSNIWFEACLFFFFIFRSFENLKNLFCRSKMEKIKITIGR